MNIIHKCISVIIYAVFIACFRLYQKFRIHSEIETGNFLEEKVSQFLDLHEFERKDVAKVTHTTFITIS